MPNPSVALPSRRPPEALPVRKLNRIRELMLRVPGSANPEGQIRNLLELCIESGVREGDTDLRSGKEALRGSDRGSEVGVPRYDHKGVAGIEVEELGGTMLGAREHPASGGDCSPGQFGPGEQRSGG